MKTTIAMLPSVCLVYAVVSAAPTLNIVSNSDWKAWSSEAPGWQTAGFDDAAWRNADTGFWYPYTPQACLNEPGTSALHMWDQRNDYEVFLRYTFELNAPVTEAVAKLRGDDGFDFYVNGTLADSYASAPWGYPHTVDIAAFLHQGQNVLAIRAWDVYTSNRSMLVDAKIYVIPAPGAFLLAMIGLPMIRGVIRI